MDAVQPDARIAPSAFRHGQTRANILHAYRNAVSSSPLEDGRVMLVGPTHDARFLEVGVRYDPITDTVTIFHAMAARQKYLR